jgi:hypothetical protein
MGGFYVVKPSTMNTGVTMSTRLTIKQAAEKYGLPVETINNMIKTGKLTPHEKDGETLLTSDDFDQIDILSNEEAAGMNEKCPGWGGLIESHKRLLSVIEEIKAQDLEKK